MQSAITNINELFHMHLVLL